MDFVDFAVETAVETQALHAHRKARATLTGPAGFSLASSGVGIGLRHMELHLQRIALIGSRTDYLKYFQRFHSLLLEQVAKEAIALHTNRLLQRLPLKPL
jgi:hypothetical protein